MIVKCDKCQTRFKVPDEKVSENGTKVRCTRCQNTFRVWRPASSPQAEPFGDLALSQVDTSQRERLPLMPPPGAFEAPKSARTNGTSVAPARTGLLGDVAEFADDALPAGRESPVDSQETPVTRVPPSAPPSRISGTTQAPSRPSGTTRTIDANAPGQSSSPQTAGRPESGTEPGATPATAPRRGLGVAVNVLVAALLLGMVVWVGAIYLHEGKLDLSSFSRDSLKSLFAGPGELLAVDVSNGLYETSDGKHVFYVRGEVENRGGSAKRARVSVEILDGSLALTSAEVVAGAAPNAEELYGVSSVADLDALKTQLEKASAEVSPGKRVPFLVAFYEYPPDLSQYRLRVTVRDALDKVR